MEPRIQYATTTDGVKIAYWALGEGYPYISLPTLPWSHCQLEWQTPGFRGGQEQRSARNMFVRYDNRGSGLSDRSVSDVSFEAHIADLDVVIRRCGLKRVCLYAPVNAGKIAIAYAAAHPERVSHLILWNALVGRGTGGVGALRAVEALRDVDWDLYLETAAHVALGWNKEMAAAWAAFCRTCSDAESAKAIMSTIDEIDVTALLPLVKAPTLVLYQPFPAGDSVHSRELAAAIPNARLVLLAPEIADDPNDEHINEAIDGFLAEVGAAPCPGGLTPREVEVLRLIAIGRTNREISKDLTLSIRTVARHITNIYSKIGARGKADATAYALRHHLLSETSRSGQ